MGQLQSTRDVRVSNAVAAGTSNITTSYVDMSADVGYGAVKFIACFGTLTATQVTSMKIQGSSDHTTWYDLEGTGSGNLADGDSNKTIIIDITKTTYRYNRAVILRGTANAAVDSVMATLYSPVTYPVTTDSTCSKSKAVTSPLVGTP